MPFDDDNDDDKNIDDPKSRLKKVSSKPSIFDNKPKKPTQDDLDSKVKDIQEQKSEYKKKASDLAISFRHMVEDTVLEENRSIFVKNKEKEILLDMINLAIEINTDPNEQEGMGSVMWITMLLKTVLSQRNKLNQANYNYSLLQKEVAQLKKKIDLLDKPKKDE